MGLIELLNRCRHTAAKIQSDVLAHVAQRLIDHGKTTAVLTESVGSPASQVRFLILGFARFFSAFINKMPYYKSTTI